MSVRACGFVIFRRFKGPTEYLLLQASYGDYHWSPPKGHTDEGESDMKTALRETEEETGLHKEDIKIYHDVKQELNYNVDGKSKIVIYWLAELMKDKEIKISDEHKDFAWLTIDEACKRAAYGDLQNTLKKFSRSISNND